MVPSHEYRDDRAALCRLHSSFPELLRPWVEFKAMAFGILCPKRLSPDGLLAVFGLKPDGFERLVATMSKPDGLFAHVMQHGVAVDVDESKSLTGCAELLMVLRPANSSATRWWWLMLARDRPFRPMEQDIAAEMVRQWQVEIDFVPEPGMGKVVVGRDDEVIHVDPYTRVHALQDPSLMDMLLAQLDRVTRQRWPDGCTGEAHDIAIRLAGEPRWVNFLHQTGEATAGGENWRIVLRPLEEEEMPLVGELEDSRIACALAYIHDRFAYSPSLNEIAEAVHISPFHFHRLFTNLVGLSPKQYLQRKQLQFARWLLRSTRKPIREVATQSGFSSHGHFASTFQRVNGMSPTMYRDAY